MSRPQIKGPEFVRYFGPVLDARLVEKKAYSIDASFFEEFLTAQ
jgi:hypothetical protein